MKRSILRAGLFIGASGLASFGCQQTDKSGAVSQAKPIPHDPTSWSDKDVTNKGDSDSGTTNGLSKSSSLPGTLSPEAQDIERSLGVGR
jgi:hypothetical protein